MSTVNAICIGVLFLWSGWVNAEALRVMNFNTMCSLCDNNHDNGAFTDRLNAMADTIDRHNPDLISIQEFTRPTQVEKLSKKLLQGRYVAVYKKKSLYPATDAVLFIRKDRFQILESNSIWLGPKSPEFSFGWKPGIPRLLTWATLLDTKSNKQFIFVGSHFDNSHENKDPSAVQVQTFFQQQSLPVIFAGDTNLIIADTAYSVLLTNMHDTFNDVAAITVTANASYIPHDFCSDKSDNDWPACRIDHVLLSNNALWKTESWGVDLYQYPKLKRFVSDHRAVIVDLY